MRILSNTR